MTIQAQYVVRMAAYLSSHQRACRTWGEYWLGRLNEMLAWTGDREITGDFRYRLAAERDELRVRLGDPDPYRA